MFRTTTLRFVLLAGLVACSGGSSDKDGTDTDVTDTDGGGSASRNKAPPAPEVRITPEAPIFNTGLEVEWDEVDDPEGKRVTYRVLWEVDDANAVFDEDQVVISPATVFRGQTWSVKVWASDGVKESKPGRASVTIGNGDPVITAMEVTPMPAVTTSTLTGRLERSDPEEDAMTTTWTWDVNGTTAREGRGANTLAAASFGKGDEILVTATVEDGQGGSTSETVGPFTIQNTPPGAPIVDIAQRIAEDDDDLDCTVTTPAPDVDEEALEYVFTWQKGTRVLQTTGPTASLTDTLPASQTEPGDTIICAVAASDGASTGPEAWAASRVAAEADVVIETMALGNNYSCAARADDAYTACWGDNLEGRAVAPEGASYSVISAGFDFACGIRDDDTLACWGANGNRAIPPEGTFRWVSSADRHSCALDLNNEMTCWGAGTGPSQDMAAPAGTFSIVDVGEDHSCAISTGSSELLCFGDNSLGQLDAPTGVASTVSTFGNHSCAIMAGGSLDCWGDNTFGQADAPTTGVYTHVAVGTAFSCAIDDANALSCWGDNSLGQTDVPTGAFERVWAGSTHACARDTYDNVVCWGEALGGVLRPPLGKVADVDAGSGYLCTVGLDGLPECWGADLEGETNPAFGFFADIDASITHSCGLTTDGEVRCWGDNAQGQSLVPGGTYSDVAVGGTHTCAIRASDGSIACWGGNAFGEATPPTTGTYVQIAAGGNHTCAVTDDDVLECWGMNIAQQTNVPAGNYTQVSAAGTHTCAILDDDTVKCWGSRVLGLQTLPALVANQSEAHLEVSSSDLGNCGLLADNTLNCWGPVATAGALLDAPEGTFKKVSAGLESSCAIDMEDRLWCWGAGVRRPLDAGL